MTEEGKNGMDDELLKAVALLAGKERPDRKNRKISVLATDMQYDRLKMMSEATGLSVNVLIGIGIDMVTGREAAAKAPAKPKPKK